MSTMKEVAKVAGVSVITVSRVINTPHLVKEATRKKIQRVMEEIGFQPNLAAKALVSNQTRTVHVFIPSVIGPADPYLMSLLAGISDELSRAYYAFLIRREWDFPYKCDGVIAMGISKGKDKEIVSKLKVPTVLFGKTNQPLDCIDINNFTGAYKMTQYLIEQGHRNIGFLAIDTEENFGEERTQGYLQALRDHGITEKPHLMNACFNTESSGFEKSLPLIEQGEMTALFCSSDVLAIGALRAARSLNKKVPEDLSIAGFDGVSIDLLADPPLTTIRQPVYEIGQELAKQLLNRLAQPDSAIAKFEIEPELVIRKSVRNIKVTE